MALIDQLQGVAAALTEGGVPATCDPPTIMPPGAWITPRRLERSRLSGDMSLVVDIYLIAPDHGVLPALATLDAMCARAIMIADDHEWEIHDTALDEAVALPTGGGPLPAFRLTIQIL